LTGSSKSMKINEFTNPGLVGQLYLGPNWEQALWILV